MDILSKFIIAGVAFIYGLVIILQGIKAKRFIHYFGRIREVTYILVMATPIIYGIIEINWSVVAAIIMFFPIFYIIIELICRYTPNPRAIEEDEAKESKPSSTSAFDDFNDKEFYNRLSKKNY
jgi:hypothetical protein